MDHREALEREMPEYCVTGGTGFIAAHLIRALLAVGHTVRATVRDPEDEGKVGFLWDLEGANERLQLVKADLMVEGSFDEAADGVDGVFHTASPVVVSYDDKNVRENLIDPIVKGAANVLSLILAMWDARASGRLVCSCDVARWSEILESLRERYPRNPVPTE